MTITLSTAAFLRYQMGDHDAARQTAEHMIALATAHEMPQWIDAGLVILACVEARRHDNCRRLSELYERLPALRLGTPACTSWSLNCAPTS
jgi:hypothetical protein